MNRPWLLTLCLAIAPLAGGAQEAAPPPNESPRPETRPQEGAAKPEAAPARQPGTSDPEDQAEALEADLDFPDEVGDVDASGEAVGDTPAAPATPPVFETLRETPAELASCVAALREHGAIFEQRDPITESDRDCGIANPLSVTEILPGIALNPDAVLRCETALAMADWMQDFVLPASDILTDRGEITAIQHGTTYQCRRRNNAATGKLSEHAFGNGVDIMGFEFASGPPLPIEPRADAGTREEAFQRAARGTACLGFTTVLGPGSDAADRKSVV